MKLLKSLELVKINSRFRSIFLSGLIILGMLFSGIGHSKEWKIHPLETQASFQNAASKKGPFTVAYMPPATEFNFYLDVWKGIKSRSSATQNNSFMFAPQSDNPKIQMKMIEEVIRRQVDAIILATHDPLAAAPLVKKAVEQGIIVVLVNSDTTSFTTQVHAVVGYLQRPGTKKLGEYILKRIGSKKLAVGIIEGAPGYHTDERVGGFLDAIKGSSLEVVSSLNGKWNTEGGYNAALKMFKGKPNIKLVFAANDFEAIGVEEALTSLNISDVMLLGNDGDPAALERIDSGRITATVYTDPVGMGKTAMQIVLDSFKGKFKGGLVETPVVIVDQSNVEKYWKKPQEIANSNDQEIIAVSNELSYLTEKDGKGLYWDILREIYAPEGITLKVNIAPAKRAEMMVRSNQADLMLGALRGEIEGVLYPQWYYSADIISVIYKKSSFPNWQGQETLANKQVVWIRGYDYDQHLYTSVNKFEVSKGIQGLMMLQKNRTDFYLDNAFNLRSTIKAEEKRLHEAGFQIDDYKIQEILRIKQYIAFANTKKGARLMKIFDDRFPILLTSGKLKKMFEKWNFEPFPFK